MRRSAGRVRLIVNSYALIDIPALPIVLAARTAFTAATAGTTIVTADAEADELRLVRSAIRAPLSRRTVLSVTESGAAAGIASVDSLFIWTDRAFAAALVTAEATLSSNPTITTRSGISRFAPLSGKAGSRNACY
jgi:hypothetical protein